MAIEFELILAGDIPLREIADLAAPEATERPGLHGYPPRLSADLDEKLGYGVTIISGSHEYYGGVDGDNFWEWEPEASVNIGFRMRHQMGDEDIPNMLAVVARVLANRSEDAAFIQNHDWLLLTRFDGKTRKHNPSSWDSEGFDEIIPNK